MSRLAKPGSSPPGGMCTSSPLTSSTLPSTLYKSAIVARVLTLVAFSCNDFPLIIPLSQVPHTRATWDSILPLSVIRAM